jgi:hypothetical protein
MSRAAIAPAALLVVRKVSVLPWLSTSIMATMVSVRSS